jgi:hypothetical protein
MILAQSWTSPSRDRLNDNTGQYYDRPSLELPSQEDSNLSYLARPQVVSKRCRLSWLTIISYISRMEWGECGGVSVNEYSARIYRPSFREKKTSPKRSFSMTENDRLGLISAKTGSVNLGTAVHMEPK